MMIKKWLEDQLFWHRLKGHKIHEGVNLFGGSTPYLCENCDKVWERFWC